MKISFDIELKRNPHKGMFVALEGIDGSGKSTQLELLKKYFEDKGRSVLATKFPRRNEGILARIMTSALLGNTSIPKPAFQYLFSADYIMQTDEEIVPALKRGDLVITDRFHCWSSVAYGLWENNPTYDISLAQSQLVISTLLSQGYQSFVPDKTFYFSVPVETAVSRLSEMRKKKEMYEDPEAMSKIIKGYEWLIKEFPKEFDVLDAAMPLAELTQNIVQRIEHE